MIGGNQLDKPLILLYIEKFKKFSNAYNRPVVTY